MRSTLAVFLACILSVCLSVHAAADFKSANPESQEAADDLKVLHRLLDEVNPPALHAALHMQSPDKFKHGVFPEDRTAIEAVYRENAPLATSIVALAKRQGSPGNLTSAAVITVVETSTRISFAATETRLTTPTPASITAGGQSTQQALSAPPPSIAVPSSISPAAAPLAPLPGVGLVSSRISFTTTNAASITIVTTINGSVVTLSPSANTNGVSTTSAATDPAPLSQTSLVIQTTTLPDGSPSTITAVTVIQVSRSAVSTAGGNAGVGSSTAPPAGLQTGLAPRSRSWGWESVGVLGGAVVFAIML